MLPNEQYFPEADDVTPHAMAFARMMIAHARFEREIRNLQGVIAGDQSFGEQPGNQWTTPKRRARMAKLIKNKLGDIEEARPVAAILTKAKKPCEDRNLLAHGTWWLFQPDTLALTVRRGVIHKGERMYVDWTVADIDRLAETFHDLEINLFKVRREIERNWIETEFPVIAVAKAG
jgi:hypothetical protein